MNDPIYMYMHMKHAQQIFDVVHICYQCCQGVHLGAPMPCALSLDNKSTSYSLPCILDDAVWHDCLHGFQGLSVDA